MKRKGKFLAIILMLCAMLAIGNVAVACKKPVNDPIENPNPDENTEVSIPEGVVDFDETWLDK